jgi:ribosomal 50S subunit-recycling heat shock protein
VSASAVQSARFRRIRAIAKKLVEGGHVTVSGAKTRKISAIIRVGDTLELALGPFKKS